MDDYSKLYPGWEETEWGKAIIEEEKTYQRVIEGDRYKGQRTIPFSDVRLGGKGKERDGWDMLDNYPDNDPQTSSGILAAMQIDSLEYSLPPKQRNTLRTLEYMYQHNSDLQTVKERGRFTSENAAKLLSHLEQKTITAAAFRKRVKDLKKTAKQWQKGRE